MAKDFPDLRPERRREKRHSTSGEVLLTFQESGVSVPGELMDVSRGGFRIKHQHLEVSLGDVVRIRLPEGEKEARVAWNRRLGGEVESGFMVTD
ncbi:MAG TPA: PilZ domain-containing protein [Terriglobales bacterium]